jgi:hypothetical protein
MRNSCLSLLCLGLAGSVNATEISFKLDKLHIETGMNATVVNANNLRARVFGFNIGVEAEDKISNDLTLFLNAQLDLETGANEAIGTIAEYEPKESVNLNAGGVRYTPYSNVKIDAGALNQGELNSPLLIGSNAFAGVKEEISYGALFISASQSIPSNNRLSKRVGGVDDGNPFFGIETVGLRFGDAFKFEATASHYKFSDLSTEVAEKSKQMGNSVEGSGAASKFNYAFEGINATLASSYTFSNEMKVDLTAQYLVNDKAPEGRNKGILAELKIGKKAFSVSFETFENGSDTSPSFYNSKSYGHNNMKGNSFGLHSSKKDLTVSAEYTTANVMEENLVQTNINIITLDLVKSYDF